MKSLLLLILFFTTSCTLFLENFSEVKHKIKVPESKICHLQSDNIFIGEDASLIKVFQENYAQWNLNRKELIYAWAMANSLARPDMINPHSFGMVFLIDKNKDSLQILKRNDFKKVRKRKIINLLNSKIPRKLKVSISLASKLKKIHQQKGKIPEKYLVANQVLGKDEIYQRSPLLGFNLISTKINSPNSLRTDSENYNCLSYSSPTNANEESFILSIYNKNWQAIIVHSNQMTSDLLKPIEKSPNLSLCHYRSNLFKNTYISYNDKKHVDLMKNLLNLGIDNIQNIEDLIYYINYPRFVLDSDAKYILMESLRADKTLETYLNTLNIPIYHKNHIGKIQSFYSFSKNKQSGILLDPREPNNLKCSIHD